MWFKCKDEAAQTLYWSNKRGPGEARENELLKKGEELQACSTPGNILRHEKNQSRWNICLQILSHHRPGGIQNIDVKEGME